MNYIKQTPKILYYRNYKHFNNELFRSMILQELDKLGILNLGCNEFEYIFLSTLQILAPLKKRYIRAHNAPFMTKELCKAFMVRSRLRNKYMKIKTVESMEAYKNPRNYCTGLLRKTKKSYYENLNVTLITDNKTFWKYIKPLSSDKSPTNSNIALLKGNKMITGSAECAEILNNFFSDVLP